MKKIYLLYCFIFLATCQTQREKTFTKEENLLRTTCDYLWNKQHTDGGWHSEYHGILRGGQAYTPFILHALLEVPDSIYQKPKDKVQKGLQFIRANLSEQGILGVKDPDIVEYPNYATAYALRVLYKYGDKAKDGPMIKKMQMYLARQQFVEARGIVPKHLGYGAWGFGETNLLKGYVGHLDLSNTRRVLQALRETGYQDATLYQNAQHFLHIVQRHPADKRRQPNIDTTVQKATFYDGGFYYSPILLVTNKAKQAPATEQYHAYFRSYATATCDGVLSLIASGKPLRSEEVTTAKKWLLKYNSLDRPDGIPADDNEQWDTVMIYYHLMVRAEAYYALQHTGDWWGKMADFLLKNQQKNGSFSNPHGARNKEDDPYLASTCAVVILMSGLK